MQACVGPKTCALTDHSYYNRTLIRWGSFSDNESKHAELVAAMLRHAWRLGVPMRWVTADEVCGEARALRNAVAESGRWYVFAGGARTAYGWCVPS